MSASDDVLLEAWEERAALIEFDGDQTRAEAEREAANLVFGQPSLPAPIAALRDRLAKEAAKRKKTNRKAKKTRKGSGA